MNATEWTSLIPKVSKDEEIRQMLKDEADEGERFSRAYEDAIDRAAGYLNREFPSVPKATWKAALRNPDAVQFTDSQRESRFRAAQDWIGTQCR